LFFGGIYYLNNITKFYYFWHWHSFEKGHVKLHLYQEAKYHPDWPIYVAKPAEKS